MSQPTKSVMDLAPYPSDDEWIEGFHPDWMPGEPEVEERGPSLIVAAFLLFAAFLFGLACGGIAVAIVRGMRP